MSQLVQRLRALLAEERGDVVVLGVVGVAALVAFAALAIDVGRLRLEKRQLQAAADAAAVAGALEISNCNGTAACTNMQTAAKQALIENGFTASSIHVVTQCAAGSASGVNLTLNNGPCALGSTSQDPNYGNASYVEAEVRQSVTMTFAQVLGIPSFPVTARAEAGLGNSTTCLYTSTSTSDQSTSGPVGMLLNGGTINASCGLMDDSGSSNALESDAGTFTSTGFSVHGGWGIDNGGTFNPKPTTHVTGVSDPLSDLTPPQEGPLQQSNNYSPGSNVTLQPGAYLGGMNINSGITVTLSPGTYYMGGSINDGGTLLATGGVTIYFSSGSLTMNSGSTAQIVAPTSGTYAGIAIYQNPSDTTSMIINGNSSARYEGAIYAPGAQLTLNSAGNTAAYTILDVNNIIVNSGANFTLGDNYSSLPGGSPIKGGGAHLAE